MLVQSCIHCTRKNTVDRKSALMLSSETSMCVHVIWSATTPNNPSWSTMMTYIDTKTHENVPDGMACHACKIESARIELFRKPVDVYNVCVC